MGYGVQHLVWLAYLLSRVDQEQHGLWRKHLVGLAYLLSMVHYDCRSGNNTVYGVQHLVRSVTKLHLVLVCNGYAFLQTSMAFGYLVSKKYTLNDYIFVSLSWCGHTWSSVVNDLWGWGGGGWVEGFLMYLELKADDHQNLKHFSWSSK